MPDSWGLSEETVQAIEKSCARKAKGPISEDAIELKRVIPDRGWIRDYIDWVEAFCDAPTQYHLFGALHAISAILGRKVWNPSGLHNYYPTIYSVVLGPSAFFHKSSALAACRHVIEHAKPEAVLKDEFTREALCQELASVGGGAMFFSEFTALLMLCEKAYNTGMKELLTDVWDCPRQRTRKRIGSKKDGIDSTWVMNEPWLNISAASTIEWFESQIRERDVHTGFLNRFCYVPAVAKDRDYAIAPPPDLGRRDDIAARLALMGGVRGAMPMSPDAAKEYEKFYFEMAERAGMDGHEDLLTKFRARYTVYAVKFAMLFRVAADEDAPEGIIEAEDIHRAIGLCRVLERGMRKLVERLAFTPDQLRRRKITDFIAGHSGCSRTELLRHVKSTKKELDGDIETLRDGDQIRVDVIKTEGRGRPKWAFFTPDDGRGI